MSIVLAYSGGLDTSVCVPYLKETYGQTVITVTVNTGGIRPEDEPQLQERSRELGAEKHVTIDGRSRLFDTVLSYLIKGNVRRGGVYPLCRTRAGDAGRAPGGSRARTWRDDDCARFDGRRKRSGPVRCGAAAPGF